MGNDCLLCRRVERSLQGLDPYFVADLGTSIVVVGDDRDGELYRGYAIVVFKGHVREPHELEPGVRSAHLEELMCVGQAVERAFSPCKINYASFGNEIPHLHWHVIPRYPGDPDLGSQPWRHEHRFRDELISREQGKALVRQLRPHLRGFAKGQAALATAQTPRPPHHRQALIARPYTMRQDAGSRADLR